MGTIGIIGGIAPESTIVYYRLIISLYQEQMKDGNYPQIILNSINLKKLLDLVGANQLQELRVYICEEIEKVAKAGADFCILASNTPHIIFDDVQVSSPLPLISIVEETCKHAKNLGLQRVGLFGTRFTMQGKFYNKVFDKQEISIITPDIDTQNWIHEKYMSELVNGIILDETKAELLRVILKLKEEQDIQGLILGGTELSLILRDGDDEDISFLDTAHIHAQSVVNKLLMQESMTPSN